MGFRVVILSFVVALAISCTYGQKMSINKKKDKSPSVSIKQITVAEFDVFTVACTYPQRIVISSASYGMDDKRVDVTSRVSDFCESSSFCRFLVSNNHPFDQDPYPNVKKELKVKYYCYGPMQRNPGQARPSGIAVQENQLFEDPCKAVGMPLQITDAYYGYQKENADITPQLRSYCQSSCSFVVANNAQAINQDPVPNQLKVLQVSFQCGGDENYDM